MNHSRPNPPNPFEQALHIIKTSAKYADVLNDLRSIDYAIECVLKRKIPLYLIYANDTDKAMRNKYPEIQMTINAASYMSYSAPIVQSSDESALRNLEYDGRVIIAITAVREKISPTIEAFIRESMCYVEENTQNSFPPFLEV